MRKIVLYIIIPMGLIAAALVGLTLFLSEGVTGELHTRGNPVRVPLPGPSVMRELGWPAVDSGAVLPSCPPRHPQPCRW